MTPPKMISNFFQRMFDTYSKDGGKLLVHLGALGWVFSSTAQLVMLWGDKKIDKDKKKFLLPQEGADALVNVALYYSICDFIKKGSDKLVETGKVLTYDVAKAFVAIKTKNVPELKPEDWKRLFTKEELKGKLTKLLQKPESLNMCKGLSENEIKAVKPSILNALETLETHKNNMGTIAAIAASVLACNIVTPYVRNKAASAYQKYQIKKESHEIRKTQIKENITLRNPLPSSFKSFNNYNSFGNIKI